MIRIIFVFLPQKLEFIQGNHLCLDANSNRLSFKTWAKPRATLAVWGELELQGCKFLFWQSLRCDCPYGKLKGVTSIEIVSCMRIKSNWNGLCLETICAKPKPSLRLDLNPCLRASDCTFGFSLRRRKLKETLYYAWKKPIHCKVSVSFVSLWP